MLGLVIFRSGINVVLAKSQHGVEEYAFHNDEEGRLIGE